ncbi:FAD-linked oxidoreductase [Pholiota conissans]|uniref:Proline dehydrogenase n=1 Tax=Pholiota conissans TaxID=109636 RepID=A0A9P6D3S2_9AGAR|nr:FAD-linked oxidoreductase [Pholiota conissans]
MLRSRLGFQSFVKLRHPTRFYSGASPAVRSRWTRKTVAGATMLTASSVILASTIYADSEELVPRATIGSLVRTYLVYSMCSIPSLVDASPKILSAMSSVPGLKQITEAFVRYTFFDQFVGADTAEETLPLLRSLRAANKGVLFAYSVEVDENEATGASISRSSDNFTDSPSPHLSAADSTSPSDQIVTETLHCIDVAADFEASLKDKFSRTTGTHGRRTWVAVKVTAMLPDAHALIALSSHIIASRKTLSRSSQEASVPFPGSARIEDLDVILRDSSSPDLTPADIQHVKKLYADLSRICAHAKEKGVKIIVDAEYSWYQPAIDAMTLGLMREYNTPSPNATGDVQPIIYGTFQCYLRRTPEQLALAIEDSRKHHYSLGVKLVRGAYHPHELEAHSSKSSLSISPDAEPPVWREKRDTDYNYNWCVKMLAKAVKEDVDRSAGKSTLGGVDKLGWVDWVRGVKAKPVVGEVAASPSIGVLFGTHNWDSCALILKELVRNGLAVEDGERIEDGIKVGDETVERVAIGQLYGMCDDLTDWVVSRISSTTPFVIKYVPYGALAEVMPYLSRRAIENKSVLGGGAAKHERQRAAEEIKKRVFG